jgi:hypothetical protein
VARKGDVGGSRRLADPPRQVVGATGVAFGADHRTLVNVSDFDSPDLQLSTAPLFGPAYTPPLLTPPSPLGGAPDLGLGLGGGSSLAMTAAFGHYTDPPAQTPLTTPVPGAPPLAIANNGFVTERLGGALNPWLADPMRVAGDAQRELDMMPRIDPGIAAQQTIVSSPTFRF